MVRESSRDLKYFHIHNKKKRRELFISTHNRASRFSSRENVLDLEVFFVDLLFLRFCMKSLAVCKLRGAKKIGTIAFFFKVTPIL